ncbi:MAG: ABC transporter ATP-binding protein/permease [Oscillospiraceae bacterium]|nr:ABC transporter ATP-binding protein/permease [Oscillospiraceae bacterium]
MKNKGKKLSGSMLASLGRAVKLLFQCYPKLAPLTYGLALFAAAVGAIPSLFIQKVIAVVEKWYAARDWAAARAEILPILWVLAGLYFLSLLATFARTQLMAYMTQGYLDKLRTALFNKMQDLPIRFFDTHKHGDVMSYYTNDVDTLRELISQSLPALLQAGVTLVVVFAIMLYFSIWMTLILCVGVVAMSFVVKRFGGGSARYFKKQQASVAATEGFVQEMMNGQKVVKVFSREQRCMEEFDRVNGELRDNSFRAHAYASTMGPVMQNIGNILYVVMALLGGLFILKGVKNFSLSGLALDLAVLIPFLGMVKQFTGNVNQLGQQINSIVMAGAGADRVFSLMDETPETDEGYVTLVNVKEGPDGSLVETDEHSGHWAWRHPHKAEGTVTYTPLRGDVRLVDVDFAYEEGKDVLHDVSVYAEPGQKVAFVGATGAGKTTITNLINRFYDIADGKIRYDGININKIKKDDLRRSLGIVLQETNLFTGTVMDNIRYGRLDASDEECREAARLAGADDFICRLPEGYDTMLLNNGTNLSQGQRQLLAIARAAVADPPVMILDEATSSIDTRTEAIVQRGMDQLMKGRTVFVIAHRLSTVMNADVIMVLDHGRIIERGSHEQLIAAGGTYYQLYTGAFELE